MKAAISGKGGVGKTTIAGSICRELVKRGFKVLAVDADPDSNLASAIGIPKDKTKNLIPIAEMSSLIEERTGARRGFFGGIFKLNPKVDDIPDKYSVDFNGIKFMLLGTIPQGGGGCFCPENVLLKALLRNILLRRDEAVVVDMEAGLEHLGRGSTEGIDFFIVVVEPGKRSINTAINIKRLAEDIGIKKFFAIGNKIRSDREADLLKEELHGFEYLGTIPYDESIIEADINELSPYDTSEVLRKNIAIITDRLLKKT